MKFRQAIRVRFLIILFPAIFILTLPIFTTAQQKIAFVRDGGSIYTMNPDGSSQTLLTNNGYQPSFSYNDNKIVFTSSRDGNDEIYIMNANGSGQTRITNNPANDTYPSFSPDGSRIVFVSTRPGEGARIYVMNADGSNQAPVPNTIPIGSIHRPVFSPDGTKIAFTDLGDDLPFGNDTAEIFIIDIDGSNLIRLTDDPGLGGNSFPNFKPDGSKIVFSSTRDGNSEIYLMNVNGSNQTRLTTTPSVDLQPTYSPDGLKIAFTSITGMCCAGPRDIYVMNADGSNAVNLTTSSNIDSHPTWGDANARPTITPAVGVTRVRNAGPSNSAIATVNDEEDPPGTLDVTVNGGPSATVNGITISNIFVDAPGNVSADISAVTTPCGGTLAGFTLRVTDSGSRFSEALLVVSTTPVPAPGALPGNAFSGVAPGPDGRLYGVTYNCGNTNDGTLYVYNPSTQFVTELYSFNGAVDGSVPYDELRFDAVNGKFYGVTSQGGPSGVGTVFTFDHATHVFTTIRSDFGGYGRPEGAPVRSNNYLYGVVRSGTGAIYRMAPDGSEFEIIHPFEQSDTRPQPLTLGDGMLYGLTLGGGNFCPAVGTGCGTVFRLEDALPGEPTQFDTVYFFPVTAQSAFINPVRGITYGSDGRLYGSTFKNVFRLDPQGTNFQTIFTGGSGNTLPLIEGPNDTLYITDYFGGPDGAGSVFSINKDGTGLPTILLTFNYDSGSNGPYGRLYRNAAGAIFGTTEYDADGAPGTIFTIAAVAPTPTPTPTFTPTPSGNTQPGNNVTVQAPSGDASVNFAVVGAAGNTTFTPIIPAGMPPAGFAFCPNCPAYDITTTAAYTPPLTVCLSVPAGVDAGTFAAMILLHGEGGVFVDVTTSHITNPDTTREVCGIVNSLSPFALAQPAVVTGTVTYGNSIGNPAPPRFVKNVSVASTVGSPAVGPVITGTPGTYTLTGFGAGSYTITPTKPGGANVAISSADAARVAQGVSGAVPFVSDNQRFAADTSGNGAVSSTDASKIAQFVTGLPFSPPNFTGQWRFFISNLPAFPAGAHPQERTYASVTSSVTGEDYIGLLIGETTGNYNPASHARPAGGQSAVGSRQLAGSSGPERGIEVKLPQVMALTDKETVILVSVQGVADKEVFSYEFDLRYDPSVIQPLENPVDVAGTVSRGLSVVANPYEPGLLRVVVYGAFPIDENGVLLHLRFTAVGAPGTVSPLTFVRIMFNEGEPRVSVVDARIELY